MALNIINLKLCYIIKGASIKPITFNSVVRSTNDILRMKRQTPRRFLQAKQYKQNCRIYAAENAQEIVEVSLQNPKDSPLFYAMYVIFTFCDTNYSMKSYGELLVATTHKHKPHHNRLIKLYIILYKNYIISLQL